MVTRGRTTLMDPHMFDDAVPALLIIAVVLVAVAFGLGFLVRAVMG